MILFVSFEWQIYALCYSTGSRRLKWALQVKRDGDMSHHGAAVSQGRKKPIENSGTVVLARTVLARIAEADRPI